MINRAERNYPHNLMIFFNINAKDLRGEVVFALMESQCIFIGYISKFISLFELPE